MKIAYGLWIALIWAVVTGAKAQLRIDQPSGFGGSTAASENESTQEAWRYIEALNRHRWWHCSRIELIAVDYHLGPLSTVEASQNLILRQGLVAVLVAHGAFNAQTLLPPLAAPYHVLLVEPSAGTVALHMLVGPWPCNVRAVYPSEVISHLATLRLTRVAMLAANDPSGSDGIVVAKKGFAETGFKPVLVHAFPKCHTDLALLVAKVKVSAMRAVLFMGCFDRVVNGIKALRAVDAPVQMAILSNDAAKGFIKLLGEEALGVVVVQARPNEQTNNYAFIWKAKKLARGLGGASPAMIKGLAAVKVLAKGLRCIDSKSTGNALCNTLEGPHKFDIGGLGIDRSMSNHVRSVFYKPSITDFDGSFMC